MNKEVAHKLGELVYALTEQIQFVRVTREKNMLNTPFIKVQAVMIKNNKSIAEEVLFSEQELEAFQGDMAAMADIMVNKIKTAAKG